MTNERRSAVESALKDVLDPCSCFTDEPVSIVELGLIEGIEVDDGTVTIDVLPTSPGCTYMPYIQSDIEDRVGELEFADTVTIDQVTDQIWTRERMAAETLDARVKTMRSTLEAEGIEPYYS